MARYQLRYLHLEAFRDDNFISTSCDASPRPAPALRPITSTTKYDGTTRSRILSIASITVVTAVSKSDCKESFQRYRYRCTWKPIAGIHVQSSTPSMIRTVTTDNYDFDTVFFNCSIISWPSSWQASGWLSPEMKEIPPRMMCLLLKQHQAVKFRNHTCVSIIDAKPFF